MVFESITTPAAPAGVHHMHSSNRNARIPLTQYATGTKLLTSFVTARHLTSCHPNANSLAIRSVWQIPPFFLSMPTTSDTGPRGLSALRIYK